MPRPLIEESTCSVLFLFHPCILYVKKILLNLRWAHFVDYQDWQKCSSYTSWEEVCEPNSMNITVHFHFSICSFMFASYSFTLSFSLYFQDLRSSVNFRWLFNPNLLKVFTILPISLSVCIQTCALSLLLHSIKLLTV